LTKPKEQIPDNEHVMRCVPYPRQEREFGTDRLLGVFPEAYELRTIDKGALSLVHIEFYGLFDLNSVCSAIGSLPHHLTKGPDPALFAIGIVSDVKAAGSKRGNTLRVVFEPSKKIPAHTALRKLPADDFALLEDLATNVFSDLRDFNGAVMPITPKAMPTI
jgi:hypothetical protein